MPASTLQDVINAWNFNCLAHSAQPVRTGEDLDATTVGSKFDSQASFAANMPGLHRAMTNALAPLVVPPMEPEFDDTLGIYFRDPGWYK